MERFWEKVDIRGADECWEWTHKRHVSGYGIFWLDGKNRRANRVALILSGEIPSDESLMALHSCDNPPCCNPSHLRWGSAKENTQDFIERKGGFRGESSPSAIINDEIASSIMRSRVDGLPASMIAKKFGVTKSLVENITRGAAWVHLHGVNGNPTLDELLSARSTVKRRAANRKVTDEMVDDILKSRVKGESASSIAKRIGLPLGTISPVFSGLAFAHRHGINGNPTFDELRSHQAPNPTYKLTEDDIIEIRSLLESGAMGASLADHYGVSRATISNIKKGKR